MADINATSEKFLRGKYAIVGVGETGFVRGSGRTTPPPPEPAMR
ncbi:MAG: hypothetical protein ACOY15_10410 [Pseudomonadota bacterium]